MLDANYLKERYADMSPISKNIRMQKDEERYKVPIVSLKKEIQHFFKLKMPEKAEKIIREIVEDPV